MVPFTPGPTCWNVFQTLHYTAVKSNPAVIESSSSRFIQNPVEENQNNIVPGEKKSDTGDVWSRSKVL